MDAQPGAVPLLTVISTLEFAVRTIATRADLDQISVSTSQIWAPGEKIDSASDLLIVPTTELYGSLPPELQNSPVSLTIALCGPLPEHFAEAEFAESPHVLLHTEKLADASRIITSLSGLADPHREAELRKLTSLQRSFSQSLSHSSPIVDLLQRLQKRINAVCLVVDSQGRVAESTGTIPLSQLMDQVRSTEAPSQHVVAAGWEGLAVRLQSPDPEQYASGGWLVSAARRSDFPSSQAIAAIHIAATLIEAARRTQVTARDQEEAIRSATFEEVLELNVRPEAPELANRLAALGLSLTTSLRVFAITGAHPNLVTRSARTRIQRSVEKSLEQAEIPYLVTSREPATVFLAQSEVDPLLRVLHPHHGTSEANLIGIGREVNSVTDIADSYADALIAIRAMRAGRHHGSVMSFEQFDYATRVFASVGLDRMAEYSRDYLAPLIEKQPMLDALRTYFQHSQNTNASASTLGIHPNTLRYRLSKVEEVLEINLSDPAVVASLFLATTALDLVSMTSPRHFGSHGLIPNQDAGITSSGIAPPNGSQPNVPSIAMARPPRPTKY